MNLTNKLRFEKLVWIIFFVLSTCLIWVVKDLSNNLAFSDQIDIFFGFLTKQDSITLYLQQHGPHRQGLGAIIMSYTLRLSNWNFSIISYLTALIMILSAYFLILSLRNYQTNLITSVACILLILSLGAGELLTVTSNISHSTLPILFSFIIFYLLTKSEHTTKKLHIFIFFIVIVSLFTGFGIFLFFAYLATLTFTFLNQLLFNVNNKKVDILYYLCIYIISGFSILIFFNNYSGSAAAGCSSTAINNIWNVFTYSFSVASIIYGGDKLGIFSTQFGFIQIVLFFMITFTCIFRVIKTGDRLSAGVLLLILVSIGFIFNVAIGRHCLGPGSAFASRYYPLTSVGVIGVLIAIDYYFRNSFSVISKIFSASIIILTFTIVFPSGWGLMQHFHSHKNNFLQCMKNQDSMKFCNEIYNIYPDSVRLQFFSDLVKSQRQN